MGSKYAEFDRDALDIRGDHRVTLPALHGLLVERMGR